MVREAPSWAYKLSLQFLKRVLYGFKDLPCILKKELW